MGWFSKKKKKEEEDDELEEEESESGSKKKFPKSKDLKDRSSDGGRNQDEPPNKRKRKETVKPWGKGERLLVLFVLLITVGLSGVLYLSSRQWKLPGLPKFSVSFIPNRSEKIDSEITGTDAQIALEVSQVFETKTQSLTGLYAVSVARLPDGALVGENELELMQAASLIKLPVMAAYYSEVQRGTFSLDDTYTLRNLDKTGGAGSLANMPAGTVFTYRELLDLMGKQSDNTAYTIVKNKLGEELVSTYIKRFGMTNTSLEKNETTARDIAVFYKKLWNNELLQPVYKEMLLANITNTNYENWIAKGLPQGVEVAHKYGREVHVINDAGIVFGPNPFVLVLLSRGVVDSEANTVFPELTSAIYDIFINQKN